MIGEFADIDKTLNRLEKSSNEAVSFVKKKVNKQGKRFGRYSFKGNINQFKDYINENFASKQM